MGKRFVGGESRCTTRQLGYYIANQILIGQGSLGPQHHTDGWIDVATADIANQENHGEKSSCNQERIGGSNHNT